MSVHVENKKKEEAEPFLPSVLPLIPASSPTVEKAGRVKTIKIVQVLESQTFEEKYLYTVKKPEEPLTTEDLEEIFEAHNLMKDRSIPALTGWLEIPGITARAYVVDLDRNEAYLCEPVGWKKVSIEDVQKSAAGRKATD